MINMSEIPITNKETIKKYMMTPGVPSLEDLNEQLVLRTEEFYCAIQSIFEILHKIRNQELDDFQEELDQIQESLEALQEGF